MIIICTIISRNYDLLVYLFMSTWKYLSYEEFEAVVLGNNGFMYGILDRICFV